MTELYQLYGISRKTGYKWIGRYVEHGPQGLDNALPDHPASDGGLESSARDSNGGCKPRRSRARMHPDAYMLLRTSEILNFGLNKQDTEPVRRHH